MQLQALQRVDQRPALRLRAVARLRRSVDPRRVEHDAEKLLRQKPVERAGKRLLRVRGEVPEKPCVELLLGKPRFEVDRKKRSLRLLRDERGGRKHQRPADAEMCEQHFAELGKDFLSFLIIGGQRDVLERQSRKLRAPGLLRLERYERALRRHDRMSERLRKPEPVARAAGGRIRETAGREDHRVERLDRLSNAYAGDRFAVRQDLRNAGVQPHVDPAGAHGLFERLQDIARMIGRRKYALSALHLQRHARRFDQRHDRRAVEMRVRAVQEPRIMNDVAEKALAVRRVRDVAAALAGDEQLLAELFVALKDRDSVPVFRRLDRGDLSRGAAADDCDSHASPPNSSERSTAERSSP